MQPYSYPRFRSARNDRARAVALNWITVSLDLAPAILAHAPQLDILVPSVADSTDLVISYDPMHQLGLTSYLLRVSVLTHNDLLSSVNACLLPQVTYGEPNQLGASWQEWRN
jgi:hypothetical protein